MNTTQQIIDNLTEHGAKVDHPAANLTEWANDYRNQVEERLFNGETPRVVIKRIDSNTGREETITNIPAEVLAEAQAEVDKWNQENAE